jgi:hypothetical protein
MSLCCLIYIQMTDLVPGTSCISSYSVSLLTQQKSVAGYIIHTINSDLQSIDHSRVVGTIGPHYYRIALVESQDSSGLVSSKLFSGYYTPLKKSKYSSDEYRLQSMGIIIYKLLYYISICI